jgi:hypothetical protein
VNVLPQANDVIVARLDPFLEPGDNIRYRFNGWKVGSQGTFNVSSVPQDDYDINREGIFRFATLPDENKFITLNYLVSRKAPSPESILVRMAEIVTDVLEDHEAYTEPNGFNEFRAVGTRIINTTDNLIYNWNGLIWVVEGVPGVGVQFFVTRKQEIWEFDGAAFNKVFDNGDAFPKPPLLDYPLFGRGITFATYSFGQGPAAPVDWPDAFEVMQHPGDAPL